MTGNLPVCGWLRVASSFIKRTADALTKTCDEKIQCNYVEKMVNDMVKRTRNDDPAKGVWNVYGKEATVWVDASSLALGVIVEVDGNIIEDACWLRGMPPNNLRHFLKLFQKNKRIVFKSKFNVESKFR